MASGENKSYPCKHLFFRVKFLSIFMISTMEVDKKASKMMILWTFLTKHLDREKNIY